MTEPTNRIAILGGGQLAMMLAEASQHGNESFIVVDPKTPGWTHKRVTFLQAEYDDPSALETVAQHADVVTFDFENVPASAADWLAEHVAVRPPALALEAAQDRANEKSMCAELGIGTAPWALIDQSDDVETAMEQVDLPAIIKTRRMGYDGKGQRRVHTVQEAHDAVAELLPAELIAEGFVDFERELSIIAARSVTGEMVFWPLTQNIHKDGILAVSIAPASVDAAVQQRGEYIAKEIAETLEYVGVFAVEFFDAGDGQLLVNEMAPRVHNSGHWTIEGAHTSQFANHLNAVAGRALVSPSPIKPSIMVNLIGDIPTAVHEVAKQGMDGVTLHNYQKSARAGRKVGHVTIVGDDQAMLKSRLDAWQQAVGIAYL